MGTVINLTPHAVGELAGKDAEGMPMFVAVVKATYEWQQNGSVRPVAPVPIQEADEFADTPATSGLLVASDLSPPKSRVDVLFRGTLAFAQPITEIDVGMRVGTRLQKAAHVFGARYWLPGVVHDTTPSKPHPTQALPFACRSAAPIRRTREPSSRAIPRAPVLRNVRQSCRASKRPASKIR
jgi:hypothetical protein